MTLRTPALLAVAAALVLSGCASTDGAVATGGPGSPGRPPAGSSPGVIDQGEQDASNLAFGTSFTYDDGISVHVSRPEPFVPSGLGPSEQEAAGHVAVTITVVNRSATDYDTCQLRVSAQSGDEEAAQVLDRGNGIEGLPRTAVPKDRKGRFTVGLRVSDPEDLVLQITPDADHRRITYLG